MIKKGAKVFEIVICNAEEHMAYADILKEGISMMQIENEPLRNKVQPFILCKFSKTSINSDSYKEILLQLGSHR